MHSSAFKVSGEQFSLWLKCVAFGIQHISFLDHEPAEGFYM